MWDMIINAGFEPKKKLEYFEFYDRYTVTKKLSMGADDFSEKLHSKYKLSSITVSQVGTEFTGLPFKFDQSNVLYNPSDAGQCIWGVWMRANRFSYLQTWLGSNINEWKGGGDAPVDQKAIKEGFNYMSNWMKI